MPIKVKQLVTLIIQHLNARAGLDPDVCMFLCDIWKHTRTLEHLVYPVCKPSLKPKTSQYALSYCYPTDF